METPLRRRRRPGTFDISHHKPPIPPIRIPPACLAPSKEKGQAARIPARAPRAHIPASTPAPAHSPSGRAAAAARARTPHLARRPPSPEPLRRSPRFALLPRSPQVLACLCLAFALPRSSPSILGGAPRGASRGAAAARGRPPHLASLPGAPRRAAGGGRARRPPSNGGGAALHRPAAARARGPGRPTAQLDPTNPLPCPLDPPPAPAWRPARPPEQF
jgi:hypothetical protein